MWLPGYFRSDEFRRLDLDDRRYQLMRSEASGATDTARASRLSAFRKESQRPPEVGSTPHRGHGRMKRNHDGCGRPAE